MNAPSKSARKLTRWLGIQRETRTRAAFLSRVRSAAVEHSARTTPADVDHVLAGQVIRLGGIAEDLLRSLALEPSARVFALVAIGDSLEATADAIRERARRTDR